jgi:glycosyltransferase involved in cell wall biosynthesis
MPAFDNGDVLLVSKPLSPPWDDSGKLLPYLVARHVSDLRLVAMTPRGRPLDLEHVTSEPVYRASSSFTVPMLDKVRLFGRLLAKSPPPVVHFFFSPNPPTVMAARAFRRVHRHARVVQTLMSLPDNPDALAAGIFADVVVAWSRAGARMAADAIGRRGLAARVVRIAPGIEPLAPMTPDERREARVALGLPPDRPLVVYAGDLEFSTASSVVAEAAVMLADRSPAVFVLACRPKTAAAALVRQDLERRLAGRIAEGSAFVMGKVPRFHDLLRCSDCQVLPADTTWAKTDVPLVLLEGLTAGVPAVVGTGTAMDELVEAGAAVGVPPLDPGKLAEAITGLLRGRGTASALGAAGRAYAMREHTAARMAEAHEALYRDLLSRPGGG